MLDKITKNLTRIQENEIHELNNIPLTRVLQAIFFVQIVDSNISEHLYEDENGIDEVSTPITTPSSESGHTYGIIRPDILATPSFTFNVNTSSDVKFFQFIFIL